MKTRMRLAPQMPFYDGGAVAAYLEKQAAKGWMLTGAGEYLWTYSRTEPRSLRFTVAYLADASKLDVVPTDGQQTLIDYCESAGWTFAAQREKLFIFWTADPAAVPLETDETVKLQSVHESQKRRFLPCALILALVTAAEVAAIVLSLRRDPVRLLSDSVTLMMPLLWLALLAVSAEELAGYALWYARSKRSVARGGGCVTLGPGWRRLTGALCGLLWALLLFWLGLMIWQGAGLAVVTGTAQLTAALSLLWLIKYSARPGKKARRATNAVALVLCLAVAGMIAVVVLQNSPRTGATAEDLPLVVEDLTGGTPSPEDLYMLDRRVSPLMEYWRGEHHVDKSGENVQYTITRPGVSGLYQMCLDRALTPTAYETKNGGAWVKSDPAPWGAETAYELQYAGREPDGYILCWPDRVAQVYFSWTPTAEQMAVAAEKLGEA